MKCSFVLSNLFSLFYDFMSC
uniref:Uncharacterized protein n=1 Tax=Rhizophora mucronata TaxID=61149 RepID=A0A2P2NCZ5_RHIMU